MSNLEIDDRLDTGSTQVTPSLADEKQDLEAGSTSVDLDAPEVAPRDPDVVDWDGPDDPQNPMNWSSTHKTITITLISLITFTTPLASSIFAPSIEQVMNEFHSTNLELASFIVSVYLLGYCFGPLVIAPLSEMYGRNLLYHICNVLFVVFTIACAKAPNLGGLIAFRFLAGLAGCCPLTLGAGTIADIVPREKRGAAMSGWILGPLIGPVIGPVAGGYLSEAKSWRWSFWLVTMLAGVITVLSFVFLRETYAYTILDRKTKRLRKETGNPKLRSALDTGRTPKELFRLAIVRPSKMLIFSPIVFVLSLYVAICYGYMYLIFTAMPDMFETQYHFSQGDVGLAYIGLGVGALLGLAVAGATSDRLVVYLTKKNGGESQPEYRLPVMIFASAFIPAGLFLFGWTAEKDEHWMGPIMGTALLGVGMVAALMSTSVYLVDAFLQYAASAMAANTVVRSLFGALLPLGGRSMFDALGLGWGSSLLAFIAVALIPAPIIFMKYGARIRQHNLFGVEF